MAPLLRQVAANVRAHRLQAALIFVTLFVASTLMSLGFVGWRAPSDAWAELHRRTGESHLWIDLDHRRLDPADAVPVIEATDGVEAVGPVMHSVSIRVEGVEGLFTNLDIREWPAEGGLGLPLLTEGRRPRPSSTPEIVLDRNLAAIHDFDVGSTVAVPVSADVQAELKVVGLAVPPEVCPYPVCNPGRVYGAPGSLAALGIDPPPSPDAVSDVVAVRLHDPEAVHEVAAAVSDSLPPGAVEGLDTWKESRDLGAIATSFETLVLGAFGLVATVVAGVLIANAVAAAVRSETRLMGLLKAIGFSGRQLAGIYVIEYLGLALVAGALGAALGVVLAEPVVGSVTDQFGVGPPGLTGAPIVAIVGAVLLVTLAFVALPLRRVARLDAVAAIRGGAERPRGRSRSLMRGPVAVAHGLADLWSRPARAALTTAGVTVAVVALVYVIGVSTALGTVLSDPKVSLYGDGDVMVARAGVMEAEAAQRALDARPEVGAVMTEYWGSFTLPESPERFNARYLGGDLDAFTVPMVEGRMFSRDGEVVVGYGLAKEFDVEVGDALRPELDGHPAELQVTGIIKEFNNLGRMITMPAETLARLDPAQGPQLFVVQLGEGVDPYAFGSSLAQEANGLLGSTPIDEDALPKTIRDMRGVMIRLTGLMAVVVGIGILSSTSLAVAERRREIGMLKAVGMTPRQVLGSVLSGASVVAIAGFVIGLPVGFVLHRMVTDAIGRGVGLGPLSSPVSGFWLALTFPAVTLVTLAGAFVPAWSASRVSPSEVLAYE